MRKIAAGVFMMLAGIGVARAEDFFGSITKVDGNKITVMKFGEFKKGEAPKPEEVTLTADDACKVIQGGKFNRETKKVEGGNAVEGGIKNKLFKKSTVMANITTDGDKVTQVSIYNVMPNNEFMARITKVDGKKVTFIKFAFGKKNDETTLTVTDGLKVTEGKFNPEAKKMEYTPLEGGLKNAAFSKDNLSARIVVDDDNNITEIRLNMRPPAPPLPPVKKDDK